MNSSILLFVFSLITSVAAFGDAGAYERLWYYYAYTLDTARNKVAPQCRGSAKFKRCTFEEFMKYIDENPKAMLPLDKKVDPFDVPRAVAALKASRYTGTYDTTLIYKDVNTRDAVPDVMRAITGFLEGNMAGADEQTKIALQQVTTAVAVERQAASLPNLEKFLLEDHKITAVRGQIPVFRGSTQMIEHFDFGQTVSTNQVDRDELESYIRVWQKKQRGHLNNIKAARDGASAVTDACIAGPS